MTHVDAFSRNSIENSERHNEMNQRGLDDNYYCIIIDGASEFAVALEVIQARLLFSSVRNYVQNYINFCLNCSLNHNFIHSNILIYEYTIII